MARMLEPHGGNQDKGGVGDFFETLSPTAMAVMLVLGK